MKPGHICEARFSNGYWANVSGVVSINRRTVYESYLREYEDMGPGELDILWQKLSQDVDRKELVDGSLNEPRTARP